MSLSLAITKATAALRRVRRELDVDDDDGLRERLHECELALDRRRRVRFMAIPHEVVEYEDVGKIAKVREPNGGGEIRMKVFASSIHPRKTGLALVPTESGRTAHLDVFLVLGMEVLMEVAWSKRSDASRILTRIVDNFWQGDERLKGDTPRDPASIRKQERQARRRAGLHPHPGLTEHLLEEAAKNQGLRAWVPG